MTRSSFFQDMLLDQIFMTDPSVISKIISFADIKKTETVLEIGAGKGDLTLAIADKCRKVITIEVDERLRKWLTKRFRKKTLKFYGAMRLFCLKKEISVSTGL